MVKSKKSKSKKTSNRNPREQTTKTTTTTKSTTTRNESTTKSTTTNRISDLSNSSSGTYKEMKRMLIISFQSFFDPGAQRLIRSQNFNPVQALTWIREFTVPDSQHIVAKVVDKTNGRSKHWKAPIATPKPSRSCVGFLSSYRTLSVLELFSPSGT